MTLLYNVKNQELTPVPTTDVPRRGSSKYLSLDFSFARDWRKYPVKTVFLSFDGYTWSKILDENSEGRYCVEVPTEFTSQKSFQVQLVGSMNGADAQTVPTNTLTISLPEAGDIWMTLPPAGDIPVYQQLVAIATETKEDVTHLQNNVKNLRDEIDDQNEMLHEQKYRIDNLPQYRKVEDSKEYNGLVSNIQNNGIYWLDGKGNWFDLPDEYNEGFTLFVFQDGIYENIQLAVSYTTNDVYKRYVSRTADDDGKYPIISGKDWSLVTEGLRYRSRIAPQDYENKISNIRQAGIFPILDSDFLENNVLSDWVDRPNGDRELLALIVSKVSDIDYVQIAVSKWTGHIYTRFIRNGVADEWLCALTMNDLDDIKMAIEDLQRDIEYALMYRPIIMPDDYSNHISNIRQPGTYNIDDSDYFKEIGRNDWVDRPVDIAAEDQLALIVARCADRRNLQIAVSQNTGDVYTRIVWLQSGPVGEALVQRDWVKVVSGSTSDGNCARIYLPDEVPENPKDGDVWLKMTEGDAEPLVRRSEMQDYVDDAIADAFDKLRYAEEVAY